MGLWKKKSLATTEFLDAINNSYLLQHIKFPTHHRQDQPSNVLDLVITSEESMIEEVNKEAPLGKSDHAVYKMKCNAIQTLNGLVAHVTSIQKGPKTKAGNYRPVILTSVVCKIMAGLVRDHLVKHMKTKFFLEDQHGLWMRDLQSPSCMRPLFIEWQA